MAIKKDIKHVIRDFINVSGGGVRLEDGQSFGEFLKNKRYGKTNVTKDGAGKTDKVGKD